jgi:hypothetical protein
MFSTNILICSLAEVRRSPGVAAITRSRTLYLKGGESRTHSSAATKCPCSHDTRPLATFIPEHCNKRTSPEILPAQAPATQPPLQERPNIAVAHKPEMSDPAAKPPLVQRRGPPSFSDFKPQPPPIRRPPGPLKLGPNYRVPAETTETIVCGFLLCFSRRCP